MSGGINGSFLEEVLEGFRSSPRSLPSKYFYDRRGAELFIEICDLEEYYPTRTEMAILSERSEEIAESLGPRCVIVELGSGEARKTEILLTALDRPIAYVPVDISGEQLRETANRIGRDFPGLGVLPVEADYSSRFALPVLPWDQGRKVAFYPGSTIGNFSIREATSFLARLVKLLGPDGALVIGVDLEKDRQLLELAYNDASGVTAKFNLNLLSHINRELGANFDLGGFRHVAIYNPDACRIEMYLESTDPQTVVIGCESFELRRGERICTEHCHKYTPEGFEELAAAAGFRVRSIWMDVEQLFSVQLLEVSTPSS